MLVIDVLDRFGFHDLILSGYARRSLTRFTPQRTGQIAKLREPPR
jgi:hypothetical protein